MLSIARYMTPREFGKMYRQIVREEETYGRASILLWHRLLEDVLIMVEDPIVKIDLIRRIIWALSKSKSLLEKIEYYIKLCNTLSPGDDVFDYCVSRVIRYSELLEDRILRVEYLSRLLSVLYRKGLYHGGDQLFNVITTIVRDFEDERLVDAYLYVGKAVFFKDFADADSIFMRCYDIISGFSSVYRRALYLIKLAAVYGSVFRDKDGRKISESWFREGIGLSKDYALDRVKFLSDALPFIAMYDSTMGIVYLDSLLNGLWNRRGWVEYLSRLTVSIARVEPHMELLDKIDRWVSRMYERGRMSQKQYAKLCSALINAFCVVDPYKAYSLLRHTPEVIACIDGSDFELSIAILENIAPLSISFTYSLSTSFIEGLTKSGMVREAICALSRLQEFFPARVDEVLKYFIEPRIRIMEKEALMNLLTDLARLRTSRVDCLFRRLISHAENDKDVISSIRSLIRISDALLRRNVVWGKQLICYIEEIAEKLPPADKAEVLAELGSIIYAIDNSVARRYFLNAIRIAEDIEPRKASRIIERIMKHMQPVKEDPLIGQLVLYARELSTVNRSE